MRFREIRENTQDFLYGDCPIFAIALSRMSGLPLQAMLDYSDELDTTVLIHAFVGYKDGLVIDANGVRSIESIEDDYPVEDDPYVTDISEQDLLALGYDGNCPTMSNANKHAKKVLADLKENVTEAAEGKNTHLEHIEDLVFLQGKPGAQSALQYINSVRDMLENGGDSGNLTVKWDGAPAIIAGIDPADGKFFVGTKGVFNATPKFVKSTADLAQYEGNLKDKLALAFNELGKLGIKNVVQGDMMYTADDLQTATIDGEESWTFGPNTVTYAVPKNSDLGKRIGNSKLGIIFHTTYTGDSIPEMQASFGADVSGLNKTSAVWVDDATYKDLSGQASLTQQENKQILQGLNAAAGALKTADFAAVSNEDYKKLFMQYVNARIKRGDMQIDDAQSFATDFTQWYNDYIQKEIAKLKNQDPAAPAVKNRTDKIAVQNKFITDNMTGIASALAVYKDIIAMKNMLINKLNKVDSIKTLIRTDTGYEVTNPEGFVAIGSDSGAVKLVDRMEFSKNNFSAVKNWSK